MKTLNLLVVGQAETTYRLTC